MTRVTKFMILRKVPKRVKRDLNPRTTKKLIMKSTVTKDSKEDNQNDTSKNTYENAAITDEGVPPKDATKSPE